MCGAFSHNQCPNSVPYHLRKEPLEGAEGSSGDGSADIELSALLTVVDLELPLFLNEELWFVALRWDFLAAGTDLHKLGRRRAQHAAALERTRKVSLSSSPSSSKANAKKHDGDDKEQVGDCIVVATGQLREKITKKTKIINTHRERKANKRYVETDREYHKAEYYLAQLAQVWDRNAAFGLCPPRPGRWPDPKLAWPGYAWVDPAFGVGSIGYECVARGGRQRCWPPPQQRLFATHHFPRRVEELPIEDVQPPVGQSSIYPDPPSPPRASYSTGVAPHCSCSSSSCSSSTNPPPPTAFISIPPPALANASDPAGSSLADASLNQSHAGKDERITQYIRTTDSQQRLFARYMSNNYVVDYNERIPDDCRIRIHDAVMRDRLAAARDEVALSPGSSTAVLLTRPGGGETRRIKFNNP